MVVCIACTTRQRLLKANSRRMPQDMASRFTGCPLQRLVQASLSWPIPSTWIIGKFGSRALPSFEQLVASAAPGTGDTALGSPYIWR
jgi:hypothetical protein